VEIWDREDKTGYAVDEVSINAPEGLCEKLYDAIDGVESDVPLCACGGDGVMLGLIEERKAAQEGRET